MDVSGIISVVTYAVTIGLMLCADAPRWSIGISLGIALLFGLRFVILADERMSELECRMDMMEERVKEMQEEQIKEMLKRK
nr:MAG TPA: hypothetical protein [Caudoviricetes sp.]